MVLPTQIKDDRLAKADKDDLRRRLLGDRNALKRGGRLNATHRLTPAPPAQAADGSQGEALGVAMPGAQPTSRGAVTERATGVAPFLQGEQRAPSVTDMLQRSNTSLPISPSVAKPTAAPSITQSLDRRPVAPLTPEARQGGQQLPLLARNPNQDIAVPAQQAIYNNNDAVDMRQRGNLVNTLNAVPNATFDPRTLTRSQRESLPDSMARRGDYSYINKEREQRLEDKYARPYYDNGPMTPEDAQKRMEESERAYDNGTPLPEGHIGRTYIPFKDRSPAVQKTAMPLEGTEAAKQAVELGMPIRTRDDMMNDYEDRQAQQREANELSRQRNEDAMKARTLGVPPALFTMRREQAEAARNLERQQLERQDREAQTAREHELKLEEVKAGAKRGDPDEKRREARLSTLQKRADQLSKIMSGLQIESQRAPYQQQLNAVNAEIDAMLRDPQETVGRTPQGAAITWQQVLDTADKRGMSPQEVIETMKQDGQLVTG